MNNEKPRRIDGVLSRALGNETLLYWADGKSIHVLNRTANLIWELCDGAHSAQEIETLIRAEFQPAPTQVDVADDVQRTLQMFVDAGLLVQNGSQTE